MLTKELPSKLTFSQKLREYIQLTKPRLSFFVVISAISGYLLAGWDKGTSIKFLLLIIGGYFVTGASNGLNQVIEREYDKLMSRTQNRPLVKGTLSVNEAIMFSVLLAVLGVVSLFYVNPLTAIFGFVSLFLYVAVYTPFKRISPWAVFIGAFPGAFPPMLGWVAVTGSFGLEPGILYFVQFMWQFPHFWAIAWVLHDDYKLGGFSLLPSKGGRDNTSAFLILVYTAFMVPVGLLAWALPIGEGMITNTAAVVTVLAGLMFLYPAIKLYKNQTVENAKKVMFASFLYLPIIQFVYLLKF